MKSKFGSRVPSQLLLQRKKISDLKMMKSGINNKTEENPQPDLSLSQGEDRAEVAGSDETKPEMDVATESSIVLNSTRRSFQRNWKESGDWSKRNDFQHTELKTPMIRPQLNRVSRLPQHSARQQEEKLQKQQQEQQQNLQEQVQNPQEQQLEQKQDQEEQEQQEKEQQEQKQQQEQEQEQQQQEQEQEQQQQQEEQQQEQLQLQQKEQQQQQVQQQQEKQQEEQLLQQKGQQQQEVQQQQGKQQEQQQEAQQQKPRRQDVPVENKKSFQNFRRKPLLKSATEAEETKAEKDVLAETETEVKVEPEVGFGPEVSPRDLEERSTIQTLIETNAPTERRTGSEGYVGRNRKRSFVNNFSTFAVKNLNKSQNQRSFETSPNVQVSFF
jgi:hypothetical protein